MDQWIEKFNQILKMNKTITQTTREMRDVLDGRVHRISLFANRLADSVALVIAIVAMYLYWGTSLMHAFLGERDNMVIMLAVGVMGFGLGLYIIGRPIARIYAGHSLAKQASELDELIDDIKLSNDYIMEIQAMYADEGLPMRAITSEKIIEAVLMNVRVGAFKTKQDIVDFMQSVDDREDLIIDTPVFQFYKIVNRYRFKPNETADVIRDDISRTARGRIW